ncbi:hypothetical protein J2S43_002127 [Catenuloplanes nepalensis]|uniref:DUF4832 domain-containing protein n=1 Tax=Catenuloplanes nepalensis TaxID=587533 RepID=A0ABT9MQC4_9ACTN|nr:carbohydrate-binding protein [Catenuloplanes nepalensis]MDP9793615.1 hypothetical protein [Catenuloplanes nepalensis]
MRHARVIALCTVFALAALFAAHSAAAELFPRTVPAAVTLTGVPARPAPPAAPDPSLSAHALTAAPSPLDNPLKGFARFYVPGEDQNAGYPRSLSWSYFGLSEVMTRADDCAAYDWSIVDRALTEMASYGNQAAIRFYLEYPGGTGSHPANAIPRCFDGHVAYRNNTQWGTVSPDYDSPYLLDAVTGFIAAFGARYDGDPRIGFINLGLVGLWGEWHTWPFDADRADGHPDLMPTDASGARIVAAFDDAFDVTKLEIRYPESAGGAASGRDVGYHDDSFCYREGSPAAGVTLPRSMGGSGYSQLQRALDRGVENKWITSSMGGEVRPEIQGGAFDAWPGGAGQVDDMRACIELEHTTWKINQGSAGYAASDPRVAEAVRLMGYDLTATYAYLPDAATGTATVGVTIENRGVAPFYYPWTVSLGLKDAAGTVVKTWDTSWDLRTVMPLRVRAFPDWNAGADYLDYGYPQYFQQGVDLSGVPSGDYQLVMRVRNPLEAISPAAKKLRFGNATQGGDGWLGLGDLGVGAGPGGGNGSTPTPAPESPDPTPTEGPAEPTGAPQEPTGAPGEPAAGLTLDDFDGTPAYPADARNDLGRWTGGNCFRNGGGYGVVSGGALTLVYDNCGWFGSDLDEDLTKDTHLVVRIRGARGGEQSHFHLSLGGTTRVFGDYTLDGGGHPTVTTAYQDIRIPMAANGIDRARPGQLAMGFWYGGEGTITIDGFRFE